MAAGKHVGSLLVLLASACVLSHSYVPQSEGRRLFGGYRIVPKACQPTMPSRIKSDEPAVCMFNYECSRRNGEVVGACVDGFLFGACCQLPTKTVLQNPFEKIPSAHPLPNLHEIDHVPDIPILLNPDGTPIGMTAAHYGSTIKTETSSVSKGPEDEGATYAKVSTLGPTSSRPTSSFSDRPDSVHNAERPQLQLPQSQPQSIASQLEDDFPALLGQQSILDDLGLSALLAHSESNDGVREPQEPPAVKPVTTLLSPDQILQIADPVDQLPALFSQGIGQSDHSSAETILLNENGTALEESHDPDDFFKPSSAASPIHATHQEATSAGEAEKTGASSARPNEDQKQGHRGGSTTQWVRFPDRPSSTEAMPSSEEREPTTSTFGRIPTVSQPHVDTAKVTGSGALAQSSSKKEPEKANGVEERVSTKNLEALGSADRRSTTPMSVSEEQKEELVRVPTITYDAPSGNKKNDVTDKEEIAINHIISILNGTTPGSSVTPIVQGSSSPVYAWLNVQETSKTSFAKPATVSPFTDSTTAQPFPYTFYKPSSQYGHESLPTETSHFSASTSNAYPSKTSAQTTYLPSSSFGYSGRPTTNPPAPTVIVLGPLGTEYTTDTTQKTVTKKPTAESNRPATDALKPGYVSTKKPGLSTTITHNISTVISNLPTTNNRVVSTSYISVNLKDGTSARPTEITEVITETVNVEEDPVERTTTKRPTLWSTLSGWPQKPSFHPKPPTADFSWPLGSLTQVDTVNVEDPAFDSTTKVIRPATPSTPCDEETPAPDDLINFPPVRNPNLNMSTPLSQQEKPTIVESFNNTGYPDIEIISENDIPTPNFIEDDVLTNKDLKDVVYNRNTTASAGSSTVTRRPVGAISTTRKPTRRPTQTPRPSAPTTRKPVPTKRPSSRPTTPRPSARPPKPTASKPKPSTAQPATTKRPQVTTKRTRPTRKPTTVAAIGTEAVLSDEESSSSVATTETSSTSTVSSSTADFRSQCGVRPLLPSGRIVGGKASRFGEWPWQVLVREATWLGLFTKNKCGGVLITDRFVITAAHCQPGFLASLVAVFGEFDISGELEAKRSITRNVRRVIVNRAYDAATFANDLALLELETPIQFDAHIVPICMPDDGIDFTDRMATVTGWGRLKYNGGVPSVLQEVQVPIIKNSVCQEMFQTAGHSKLILDSFLCAGYANGQKDSCEGDSGGPLVMKRPDGRWFLVGTVSHGIKCAAPYLPGVYMRTTYFKPWLHTITGVPPVDSTEYLLILRNDKNQLNLPRLEDRPVIPGQVNQRPAGHLIAGKQHPAEKK
ncbi:hypothetical protein KM043_008792 [Ampulex compressa]|nr:hypothetical protein KM043_008792 [Ampulex compressa]